MLGYELFRFARPELAQELFHGLEGLTGKLSLMAVVAADRRSTPTPGCSFGTMELLCLASASLRATASSMSFFAPAAPKELPVDVAITNSKKSRAILILALMGDFFAHHGEHLRKIDQRFDARVPGLPSHDVRCGSFSLSMDAFHRIRNLPA